MVSTPATTRGTGGWRDSVLLRLLALLVTVFVFFLAINLMGAALKGLAKSYVQQVLSRGVENPLAGLLLGVLLTSIIQSSSTTTSIVVGLTATGTIPLPSAIPIIMGANIGTTVTNTMVSFTHVGRKQEFRRAVAAGTVHDWFNIMATVVLFPTEVVSRHLFADGRGLIERCAVWLKEAVIGTSFGKVSGLKTLIDPLVHAAEDFLHYPGLTLLASLVVLFAALVAMVKIMRSIFITKMAKILDRVLFRNAGTAFVVGIVFTMLVQSSSVTTSLIVPLVGAGILSLEQVFPYTLGANIGTTVTAFLAALALAAGAAIGDPVVGLGVTVAIVHLLFNVYGILLIYPLRAVPLALARWLARLVTTSRKHAVGFIIVYFAIYLVPFLFLILLSGLSKGS